MEEAHPRTDESEGDENALDTKVVLVGPDREGVSTEPPPPREIAPRVAMDLSAFRLNLEVSFNDRFVFPSALGVLGDLGVRGVAILVVIVLSFFFFCNEKKLEDVHSFPQKVFAESRS